MAKSSSGWAGADWSETTESVDSASADWSETSESAGSAGWVAESGAAVGSVGRLPLMPQEARLRIIESTKKQAVIFFIAVVRGGTSFLLSFYAEKCINEPSEIQTAFPLAADIF